MKKLLLASLLVLFYFDLIGQAYEPNLNEKYDSIPTQEWNRKFIATINNKFDSLVREGVDSLMVYYDASPYSNFALLIQKKSKSNCTIAYYQYVPHHSRLGNEVIPPSVLDSTDILSFYLLFKNSKGRSIPLNLASSHLAPTFARFHFGLVNEVYAVYTIMLDTKFHKAEMMEYDRIITREKMIYDNKNKSSKH